jgi:hypothetical protein
MNEGRDYLQVFFALLFSHCVAIGIGLLIALLIAKAAGCGV